MRGETLAPSLLLKPGEDVAAVIKVSIIKQIQSVTVALLHRAMANKQTRPKIFNRKKSVADYYFTIDIFYHV